MGGICRRLWGRAVGGSVKKRKKPLDIGMTFPAADALGVFPERIETFRILAMGGSLVNWMRVWTEHGNKPNDVNMGINLVPGWIPHMVTHGIAMDDVKVDRELGYVKYVDLLESSKCPLFVSTKHPHLGANFIEYPISEIDRELARIIPGHAREHLWVNTLVYAAAMALWLNLIGRGVERLEIYGWGHRTAESLKRPRNWRDYHGPRTQAEPGSDEMSYLLAKLDSRGVDWVVQQGDPLMGADRWPMLHGYEPEKVWKRPQELRI